MGRSTPLNGTVGVIKPKLQFAREQIVAGNTTDALALIDEALELCDLELQPEQEMIPCD